MSGTKLCIGYGDHRVTFVNQGGLTIARFDGDGHTTNAERFVHAVNNHDKLVEALKACAAVLSGDTTKRDLTDALEIARAALTSAKGE